MSSQRSSRLQLPKKPKCVSAPAQALNRDQKHIDEATKLNLKSPAASVGAQRHGNDAGAATSPIGHSVERHLRLAKNGAQAESRNQRKEKGSPETAVHLDSSPASIPEGSKRNRTASKKRQLLEDSEDDDNPKGKGDSDSEQSAAGESQGESGSEFSGEESESSEDADSDVADSEDEEESQAPKKKPKQVRAKVAAPKPKKDQKKSSAPAPPANGSSAAARKAQDVRGSCSEQAAGPAARSGHVPKAQQPGSGNTSIKGAAAQKSAGAKPETKQPLQPRAEVNTASPVTAAPSKGPPQSKGGAAAAPAAAAGAGAKPSGEETPLLKRVKPGASLATILSGGPVYRVAGLRRAGGIKLHNVGPKRE